MIMKLPKALLKKYEINFTDEHWIPKRKPPKSLVRMLYAGLRGDQYYNKFYKFTKMCYEEGCVCPDCYKVTAGGTSGMRVFEIKEIAEGIDLDEFYIMGDKKYLAKYNEDKIDFLKISMEVLYAAVFIKERTFDN